MYSNRAKSRGLWERGGRVPGGADSPEPASQSFRIRRAQSSRLVGPTDEALPSKNKTIFEILGAKGILKLPKDEQNSSLNRTPSAFLIKKQPKKSPPKPELPGGSTERIPSATRKSFLKRFIDKNTRKLSPGPSQSSHRLPTFKRTFAHLSSGTLQSASPSLADLRQSLEARLTTDFDLILNRYRAIYTFCHEDLVTKEQYWNKRNCVLYFINERMIADDLKEVNKLQSDYGRRRTKICEENTFRFSHTSIHKVKKYLEFFCSEKIREYKENFNDFISGSATFVVDLFGTLAKEGPGSLLHRLDNGVFFRGQSVLAKQVLFIKTLRLIETQEKLIDCIFSSFNSDLAVIDGVIEALLPRGQYLQALFSGSATPRSSGDPTLAHEKAKILKTCLKKYLNVSNFNQTEDLFALTALNKTTIATSYRKYVGGRLDYRLYSIKLAYRFYLVYCGSGEREKGLGLLIKALNQNFDPLLRYLNFLIKYQQIYRYVLRLQDLHALGSKWDTSGTPWPPFPVGAFPETKPETYFDIINEIFNYNSRPKYLRVVFRKLAAMMDLEFLNLMMETTAREALNAGQFTDSVRYCLFTQVVFEFVALYEFYNPLADAPAKKNHDKTQRLVKLLELNRLAYRSNNLLIEAFLALKNPPQLAILFATNSFIYRNSLIALEGTDPSNWPEFPGQGAQKPQPLERIVWRKNGSYWKELAESFGHLNEEMAVNKQLFARFVSLVEGQAGTGFLAHRKELVEMMTRLDSLKQFSEEQLRVYLAGLGLKRKFSANIFGGTELFYPFHLGLDDPDSYLKLIYQKIKQEISVEGTPDSLRPCQADLLKAAPKPKSPRLLSRQQIISYMDITREDPLILDLIFRMNLLLLEADPVFSDPKTLRNDFNKFGPEARSILLNSIRDFSNHTKRLRSKELFGTPLDANEHKHGVPHIDLVKKRLLETPRYSAHGVAKFVCKTLSDHQVESLHLTNTNSAFKKSIGRNCLNLQPLRLPQCGFRQLVFRRDDTEYFRHLQTQEKTKFLSSHLKSCYQQQLYLVIRRELEEEAKAKYVQETDKRSHSLDLARARHPNVTFHRLGALIDHQFMSLTAATIAKNLLRKRAPKRVSRRNITFLHFINKRLSTAEIQKFSPEKHFQEVFEMHEEDYVDPIHSIKGISKSIIEFSEHQLVRSYFLGLSFEQTKEQIGLQTIFNLNKRPVKRSVVTIWFPLLENLNSRYNKMVQQKSALFYTILPVFHQYLMDTFFRTHLFDRSKLDLKGSIYEPLVTEMLKKTGFLFSMLFIKLDSRCLATMAGIDMGLYNWMDFCFLTAFISIVRYLLVLTKCQIRKPNGVILKSDFNFEEISACGYLRANLMAIYVRSIIGQRILYHVQKQYRQSQRAPLLKKSSAEESHLTDFSFLKMSSFEVLKKLMRVFADQLHLQKICRPRLKQGQIIVGSRLLQWKDEFILMIFLVEVDAKALENGAKFCERYIDQTLEKIERRVNKRLDKEGLFSILLAIIATNVFKFRLDIQLVTRTGLTRNLHHHNQASNPKTPNKRQFDSNASFISCSKMLVFYCFPELLAMPLTSDGIPHLPQRPLRFLDTTLNRFFVEPCDSRTFLPLFNRLVESIPMSQYLYQRGIRGHQNTPTISFDYIHFNQKFDHLSDMFKCVLQNSFLMATQGSSIEIQNLNIVNLLNEFIQTRSGDAQQNVLLLNFLIPRLHMAEDDKDSDTRAEQARLKALVSQKSRLEALHPSLKTSLSKNKIFLENFKKIRKEVEVGLQVYQRQQKDPNLVARLIRKSSESSLDDLKLILNDPLERAVESDDDDEWDRKFEANPSEANTRIIFAFHQKGEVSIQKNDHVSHLTSSSQPTFFLCFEGEPRDWGAQKLVGPMQPRSTLKWYSLDPLAKFPLRKSVMSIPDCLNLININLTRNSFQKAMLFHSLASRLILYSKSVMHSAKRQTKPYSFPNERYLGPSTEEGSVVNKKLLRSIPANDSLINRIISAAGWNDCLTNLMKMVLATQNNIEEIIAQSNQAMLLLLKEFDFVEIPPLGRCQVESRFVISSVSRLIISVEEDRRALVAAVGGDNVPAPLVSNNPNQFVFTNYLYFRTINFLRIHEETCLKKVRTFMSIFPPSDHFLIRVTATPFDFKYRKYLIILSPSDISLIIRNWIYSVFIMKKKVKKPRTSNSGRNSSRLRHFQNLPVELFRRLLKFGVDELVHSLKTFFMSSLRIMRETIYKTLCISSRFQDLAARPIAYRNDYPKLDASVMKSRPHFLKRVNGRTVLIAHTVIKRLGMFFVVTAWVNKPRKQLKVQVYNPKHKKFSIFWYDDSEFAGVRTQALSDFVGVFLTEKIGNFCQRDPPKAEIERISFRMASKLSASLGQPQLVIKKEDIINELVLAETVNGDLLISQKDNLGAMVEGVEDCLLFPFLRQFLRKIHHCVFRFGLKLSRHSREFTRQISKSVSPSRNADPSRNSGMTPYKLLLLLQNRRGFDQLSDQSLKRIQGFTIRSYCEELVSYRRLDFWRMANKCGTHFVRTLASKLTLSQDAATVVLDFAGKRLPFPAHNLCKTITANGIDFDIEVLFIENPLRDQENPFCIRRNSFLRNFTLIPKIRAHMFTFLIKMSHPFQNSWTEIQKTMNLKEIITLFKNDPVANPESEPFEMLNLCSLNRLATFLIWKMMQAGSVTISFTQE